MKKVRVILASAACMVAAAGVFANKAKTVLNTYFVPSYTNKGQTSGLFCSIAVSSSCSGTGARCTAAFVYSEETTVTYHPIVSKRIHKTIAGEPVTVCTAVFKP